MDTAPSTDPILTCAYSGAEKRESDMVQIGGHWIAAEHKDACVQFLQQGGALPVSHGTAAKAPPPYLVPVWKESWRLFVLAFPAMFLVDMMVWLPGSLLSSYMDYQVFGEDDIVKSIQFSSKLRLWIGIIAEAGCLHALGEVWRGRRPVLLETVGAGFRFWPRVWLVNFLWGLASVAGLLLLIVPGIIFYVRYTFAMCYAVDDNRKATDALGASFRLSKGAFWRITGTILLTGIVTMLPLCCIGVAQAFLPETWDTWQLNGVLTYIGEIPLLFVTVVIYVLWQALRQKQEDESISRKASSPVS